MAKKLVEISVFVEVEDTGDPPADAVPTDRTAESVRDDSLGRLALRELARRIADCKNNAELQEMFDLHECDLIRVD